jgi:hypothetical protein
VNGREFVVDPPRKGVQVGRLNLSRLSLKLLDERFRHDRKPIVGLDLLLDVPQGLPGKASEPEIPLARGRMLFENGSAAPVERTSPGQHRFQLRQLLRHEFDLADLPQPVLLPFVLAASTFQGVPVRLRKSPLFGHASPPV